MSVSSPELLGLTCEIADTLALAAPRGWKRAVLPLDNRGGKLRVVSVDATLDSPPGPKPEISMELAARLGGMSEALTEMLHLLHHGGVDWDGTRASAARPHADQFILTLLNRDDRPATSVSLPRPYLDGLFLTEALFDALLEAGARMEALQRGTAARVAGLSKWHYSQPDRRLTFEFPDRPALEVPAQILGMWSGIDESWLWGWANSAIEPGCTDEVERALRPDDRTPGFAVLWREKYPCEEAFASQVAHLAGVKMNAKGVYRGRVGSTWAYFALLA